MVNSCPIICDKNSYHQLLVLCVQSDCEASDDVSLTSPTSNINLHSAYKSPNQGGKDDGNGDNHDNYARYGWDDDDSDDKLGAKALKCQ